MAINGGFQERANLAEQLVDVVEATILTEVRYARIRTGIEERFGKEERTRVHRLLYNSMGPTTDLLRYFPDDLYFDRRCLKPSWESGGTYPKVLPAAVDESATGMYSFFVEYKYSCSERTTLLRENPSVPTPYIGQIEREAWLTYKRLTDENRIPVPGHYLEGKRTEIALFYAATYAPGFLYAQWEHLITPIAIQTKVARPGNRSNPGSKGSGTPFINFDIRTLKPLENFLAEDLFWDPQEASAAMQRCKSQLLKGTK